MENLITCSRVLYDKDISDKMKEITSLKIKLIKYETPQIEYSSQLEWEIKVGEAYQIIKNGLNKWIIENHFEYDNMSNQVITPRQRMRFPNYIEQALYFITKENNKDWCYSTSVDIMSGIETYLDVLIKTGYWDLIYNLSEPEKISNLIYNTIILQIERYIEFDLAIFTCELCGKKDNYINDENICFDCQEKNNDYIEYK